MKITKLVAPLRPCHDLDGMVKDIKINGLQEPIVIDRRNCIIDGVRRYYACLFLGCNDVPVKVTTDE